MLLLHTRLHGNAEVLAQILDESVRPRVVQAHHEDGAALALIRKWGNAVDAARTQQDMDSGAIAVRRTSVRCGSLIALPALPFRFKTLAVRSHSVS